MMKQYVVTFLMMVCVFIAYSQNDTVVVKSIFVEPHDFSYENKWEYFDLKRIIRAQIIDHKPAILSCGVNASASITIAKLHNGDIIRVLDMCNMSSNYIVGEWIRIKPDDKPSFGVILPFAIVENKLNAASTFDVTVFKTTWGEIL